MGKEERIAKRSGMRAARAEDKAAKHRQRGELAREAAQNRDEGKGGWKGKGKK